jgi:hypothetical protein
MEDLTRVSDGTFCQAVWLEWLTYMAEALPIGSISSKSRRKKEKERETVPQINTSQQPFLMS